MSASAFRLDADKAIEFLTWLYPSGPWVITAIEVDQRGITTATFGPKAERELRAFLAAHEQRNIYYDVNVRRPDVNPNKKAYKKDIASVPFLHVDVDPRVGEPLAEERERIRGILQNPPAGFPPPSAIVFSGGGYNALWRLEEPLVIDGDDEATRTTHAENAERYNRTFQIAYDGGDHCFNIDRILRLPGTVNWPDAKKRGKGRVPTVAAVVYTDAIQYPIALFRPTDPVQSRTVQTFAPGGRIGDSPRPGAPAIATGNIPRLASVDDLPERVPLWVKVLIVQGTNPEEPQKYKSRSEALFACVCELVRCGVDNETIYAVITDPDFAISSSVLDKGTGKQRYAERQINQAHEHAINPMLAELNQRHAVIENYGGKCLVIEEDEDPDLPGRTRISKQAFSDFSNRYMHIQVKIAVDKEGQAVTEPAGSWWLRHAMRRQYRTVTFAPGRDIPGVFNLWKGFAVEPREGTLHLGYLEHIKQIICNGDQALYDYLIRWMARCVQRPAEQGEVAVVLRGKMGTGKGVFCREFGALWGRHYLQISNSKHLVGDFNAHLRDCVVLFADEAFFAGDRKNASHLKALITEDRLMVEGKGVDSLPAPNYLHIIMASNEDWVIPAGREERRYLVLDVSDDRLQEMGYFATLRKSMEDNKGEGRRNLLHYLLTYDLSGFEVRNVPKTAALHEQKLMSLSSEQEWWFKKLEDGILLPTHHTWTAPVTKHALVEDYLTYAQRLGIPRRLSETMLARFVRKMAPNAILESTTKDVAYGEDGARSRRERVVLFTLPPLAECRTRWEELAGGIALDWNQIQAQPEPFHPNHPATKRDPF